MSKNFGGIDPTSLERAAEAVRELNSSPNASQIILLQIKQQEANAEQSKVSQKDREIKKVQIEHEERRKTLDRNLEINKETARYNDKLERKRQEDILIQQAEYQDKQRLKQEEALKREQKIKLEALEKQLQIEEKKIKIKGQIDAEMYRKNHDLHRQELIIKEQERRETLKQLFLLNFSQVGNGVQYVMNNPSYVFNFFLYTAAISSAYYLSKSSILLGMRFVESRFNKPSLIRETSRLSYNQFYKVPVKMLNNLKNNNKQQQQKKIFDNIILHPDLKSNLETISYSLINKKMHNAPLRNILFYGPPGTGKTLFAKQLAYSSGLDFAIMTGADVAPLGSQSVHELHKVFDWANTNQRGMLLFIDEADAYFRKRDKDEISENLRNAINAFLYRTGTPSKKIMIVLATNQPDQLDKAIQDRMDQVICFDLPEEQERTDLLFLYFTKYCDPNYRFQDYLIDIWRQPSQIFITKKLIRFGPDITSEFIESLSDQVEGFSAREIEKFVIACHDKAFSNEDPVLTQELVNETLKYSQNQHKQRQEWLNLDIQE